MGGFSNGTGRDQAAFMAARIPSFTHFLSSYDPGLLPLRDLGPLAGGSDTAADVIKNLPHATTIVAVACERGVVMAGDRRATAGNMISKRDVEKVFRADEYSAIAIAGRWQHGARVHPPVRRRARALREDGGPLALPRGQGQPARQDDPRQPDGSRCRAWR